MMISDARKFIYTAPTKTATQTMFRVLAEHYGAYLILHVNAHSVEIPPHAADYFKFVTVRHPFSRAASLWWSTTQINDGDRYGFRAACPDPDDFTAFCEWLATDAPVHELTRTLCQQVDGVQVDAVLRFESLAEDFARLPFYDGSPREWPRENQTINLRDDWRAYMTPEAARWIHQWCGGDFERFGYSNDYQ